ncbi:MAG TPA: DUF6473 family protein [Rhizomicrobium sp.]
MKFPLTKYHHDSEIVDYGFVEITGCSFAVRGPTEPRQGRLNVACLGSAATFGRYVRSPFPALLAEDFGANVMNLGFGGARFETYLKEPATLALCRQCDLVILELMSARSYTSDIFRSENHLTGKGSVGPKYAKLIAEAEPDSRLLGGKVFVDQAHEWAVKHAAWDDLVAVREQLLRAYRDDAIRLIEAIGRPVLLLWLSQRSMDVPSRPGSRVSWDCGFPHFVDRQTVDAIREHAAGLVEIVSKRGLPSTLVSSITGQPLSVTKGRQAWLNSYYPSAEMHSDAARAIAAFLREFRAETPVQAGATGC